MCKYCYLVSLLTSLQIILKQINMNKKSKLIPWILAIIITLSAVIYQRATGPTYPKKVKISINNTDYKLSLLRSSSLDQVGKVKLEIPDNNVSGKLFYKSYPSGKEWIEQTMLREDDNLTAIIPGTKMAEKFEYYVELKSGNETIEVVKESPVVIRFKGGVPAYILIPHILTMFLGMLFANFVALIILFKHPDYKFYLYVTFILLSIGGMILGPFVQLYAFDELWAGVPFGWDLTDNKMLIGFLVWGIAVAGNIKKDRPYLAVIAAVITLIIFSIPHSMYGSELDATTGKIIQG